MDDELRVETVTNTDDPEKSPMAKDQAIPRQDYPQLKGYFDLENPSSGDKSKLAEIWDYLSEESGTPADVLYKLRQMENRLAMPPLGQSRLSYLADYIRVLNNVRHAEKEQDRYLRS